jgi:hypothetical protein
VPRTWAALKEVTRIAGVTLDQDNLDGIGRQMSECGLGNVDFILSRVLKIRNIFV